MDKRGNCFWLKNQMSPRQQSELCMIICTSHVSNFYRVRVLLATVELISLTSIVSRTIQIYYNNESIYVDGINGLYHNALVHVSSNGAKFCVHKSKSVWLIFLTQVSWWNLSFEQRLAIFTLRMCHQRICRESGVGLFPYRVREGFCYEKLIPTMIRSTLSIIH